jgi:hypothetical protein
VAALGAVLAALILLVTAWVLGVTAVVLLLAGALGMVGALATVTGGLVVLALAIVGLTRWRNRRTADDRAATRALWTATAVNAAGTLLRRGPLRRSEAAAPGQASVDGGDGTGGGGKAGGGHRSALLIGGGIALILLGLFLPSGTEEETEPGAGPGPEDAA